MARSMVELAEAKKWNTIKVKGADEFKREVWLQASLRGMQVQGYKPNDIDLAKLVEQRKERGPVNTIEDASRERQNARDPVGGERARKGEARTADKAEPMQAPAKDWASNAVRDITEKATPVEATDKKVVDEQKQNLTPKQQTAIETLKKVLRARGDSEKAIDMASKVAAEKFYNNRVYAGKIVEHGEAPYENNKENEKSYYVRLDTPAGEKVVWGIDLQRAIDEGGAKKGDVVAIAYQGKKEVTVPVKERDGDGSFTGKTLETKVDKNFWDVSKLHKLREDAKDRLLNAARETDRHQPVINVYDRAAPRNVEREVPARAPAKERQPEHAGRG